MADTATVPDGRPTEHPSRTPEPNTRATRARGSGVRFGCSARVFGWPTIGNGGRVSHRARSQERAPMPTDEEDLPGTIERSPKKAQRTYAKALDSAHEQYGSEERAHRVAYSALKHSFEKVSDRWEPKDEKDPSDERADNPRAREGEGETAGGVDVKGHTKEELYERAKDLGVSGRSKMSKRELGQAIARKQD